MLFFHAADVISLDTWHVSGLSGTGSIAFEVRDLFVPERHASGYLVKAPPDRPLFRFPGFSPLAQGIGAVGIGIARASIAEFVRIAAEKRRAGSSTPLAERPYVQMEVAKAEARLRSARAFFYESINAGWAAAQSGEPVALSHNRDVRLATTHTMQESAAVVDAMYTLAGGTSVYESSPLQRQFRDVHVATQHIMVSPGILETAGGCSWVCRLMLPVFERRDISVNRSRLRCVRPPAANPDKHMRPPIAAHLFSLSRCKVRGCSDPTQSPSTILWTNNGRPDVAGLGFVKIGRTS